MEGKVRLVVMLVVMLVLFLVIVSVYSLPFRTGMLCWFRVICQRNVGFVAELGYFPIISVYFIKFLAIGLIGAILYIGEAI